MSLSLITLELVLRNILQNCGYVCICMCLNIWMCAVCIVHVQDTYTNVYVQDTYTNVYRPHMHMHAYMHAYLHTLVGSGPLFPQSVLQCLCSCAVFRRILCSIAICVCERVCVCVCHGVCVCMCVGSATVIITADFCAQVCMHHRLRVSAN